MCRGIRALRSLLVEIYPPSLHDAGLAATLSDLLASFAGRGVEARRNSPACVRRA